MSQATIVRWLIGPEDLLVGGHPPSTSVPHSIKKPLEHRVWYAYPGQGSDKSRTGSWIKPSTIGRVLDDASSQIWQRTTGVRSLRS